MRMRACVFVLLNLVILCRAWAGGTTTYNNEAAFDFATTGLTTIDFGTAAPPPSGGYTLYPTGLTLSGVTFTGETLGVVSDSYCCSTYYRGFDSLDAANSGINVALPSDTTAVGFLLYTVEYGNTVGSNVDNVDITLGGQTFTVTTEPSPNSVFVGFVSSSPISSVSIVPETISTATYPDIMNFSFGSAATNVPEGGSIWLYLLLTGPASMGAIFFAHRKGLTRRTEPLH